MSESPSTSSVVVSQAMSEAEREAVFRFRYDIYINEMGKAMAHNVDRDRQWLTDEFDAEGEIFVARINGQLGGTLRSNVVRVKQLPVEMQQGHLLDRFELFGLGDLTMTSRLMVAQPFRKTMALPRLLMTVYEHVLHRGGVFDFCNCTPDLVPLYQGLGYRRYTEEPVDTEIGFRVPLVMMVGDAEHLQAMRSPFWRILKKAKNRWADAELSDWFHLAFPISEDPQPWELDEDAFWQQMSGQHALSHRFGPLRVVDGQLVSMPIDSVKRREDQQGP